MKALSICLYLYYPIARLLHQLISTPKPAQQHMQHANTMLKKPFHKLILILAISAVYPRRQNRLPEISRFTRANQVFAEHRKFLLPFFFVFWVT